MANNRLYPVLLSSDEDDFMKSSLENNHSDQENIDPSEKEAAEESLFERRTAQVAYERNNLNRTLRKSRSKKKRGSSLGQKMLSSLVIGTTIGLAISLLITSLKREQLKGNFLDCSKVDKDTDEFCIKENDKKNIISLMTDIHRNITGSLSMFHCKSSLTQNFNLTYEGLMESRKHDHMQSNKSDILVEAIYHLILKNPQWNLRLVNGGGIQVSIWTKLNVTNVIIEAFPNSESLWCWTIHVLWQLWHWLKWLIAALLVVVLQYSVVQWYAKKRETEITATFIMVEKILEVLWRHYEATKREENLLPFVAIEHVNEMLLTPPERKSKKKIWDKAVEWIATHESRVCVEKRPIADKEFVVWRWIQIVPSPSSNPVDPESKGDWQGRATDHYSSDIRDQVAPSSGPPSKCIRLKNMFETIGKLSQDQVQSLENSVLYKCIQFGGVLHIKVDKRSTHGCIYFKMDSLSAAVKTYKTLHCAWYKGRLVTAKYLPESKYHKWFPEADKAKKLLYPIN